MVPVIIAVEIQVVRRVVIIKNMLSDLFITVYFLKELKYSI